MRAARDSFLHFLADNLTGVTVRNVRRDTNSPDLSTIQTNAVNVRFGLGDRPDTNVGTILVSIDVAHEEELSAIDLAQQTWKVLGATGYTPQKDYTNPASPVPLGSNIYWDVRAVNFRPVYSDLYFHYSCLLTLSYHPY